MDKFNCTFETQVKNLDEKGSITIGKYLPDMESNVLMPHLLSY